jgi:hypothetical protein
MAVFMALAMHFVVLAFLHAVSGFSIFFYLRPLAKFDSEPREFLIEQVSNRIDGIILYILCTCVAAFLIGLFIARLAMFGFLRQFLATHGWAYDLIREKNKRSGVVTTYVLTNSTGDDKNMMYVGHLEDFYLEANGFFSYIVLKNCSRCFMAFGQDAPTTTARVPLFRVPDHAGRHWEHLVIPGSNIANVLFDPLGEVITETEGGTRALDAALAAAEEEDG